MAKKKEERLSGRKRVFAENYSLTHRGAESARKAGYAAASSAITAAKLLKEPKVQEFLVEREKRAQELLEITHQDILKVLKAWVMYDLTETIGLTPEEIKLLPIEIRTVIKSYKHKTVHNQDGSTSETIELSFVSKEKAIEMVNKHIGFYEKNNEQSRSQINVMNVSQDSINDILLNAGKNR